VLEVLKWERVCDNSSVDGAASGSRPDLAPPVSGRASITDVSA
jgi:hypothetical protein